MLNMQTLPLVREQLKIRTHELRRLHAEKNRLVEKFSDLIISNQQEISNLRESIKRKDDEIKKHQGIAWAARMAKHVGKDSLTDFLGKFGFTGNEEPGSAEAAPDPQLQRKYHRLLNRAKSLRDQISQEKEAARKLEKDRDLLIKELRRLRNNSEKDKGLKGKISELQSQLRNANEFSMEASANTESLLDEKDALIQKYEQVLYGDHSSDPQGKLPSEIIQELREELEFAREEKVQLVLDLDTLKEDHAELASKIYLLEELHEQKEAADYRPNRESRAAKTAEFSAGLENFLITYSDMITLLLVIFVLLYTISQVDQEKFAEALSSFQDREFRVEKYNVRLNQEELAMLHRVRDLVQDNVDPESLVRSDVRTILIRLKSSDLFNPGSAELLAGADTIVLDAIRENMQEGVKQVMVDGHTDDVPIHNQQYPSNWELSTARASSVARIIIGKLDLPPERMAVTGYGQYRPWKPNSSDQNRALNRRVDIKILKDIGVAEQEKKTSGSEFKNEKIPVVKHSALP